MGPDLPVVQHSLFIAPLITPTAMSEFHDPVDPANLAIVKRYLSSALECDVTQFIGIPEPTRGGIENRNYEITAIVEGQTRRFILRCPPAATAARGRHDLHREFRVLQELQNFPTLGAPRAYGYDASETFGVPCFLTDLPAGAPLTERLLLKPGAQWPRAFAERLAVISRVDYAGNPWLNEHLPRWTNAWWFNWVESTVKLTMPGAKDALYERAMAWLKEKLPPPGAQVFAHGDAHPNNFFVSGERIVGVTGWELAGVSDDPFSDIGLFVWLHDGQLARPLAQELSEVLQRDIRETKWYFVRAWFAITVLGTDATSEFYPMRRDVLAQLIGSL